MKEKKQITLQLGCTKKSTKKEPATKTPTSNWFKETNDRIFSDRGDPNHMICAKKV